MHVGGVEVVLLVPGRGRQHDVGIEAARRHAEIERDERSSLPSGAGSRQATSRGFAPPVSPRSLPCSPWRVPRKCLRKYSWPLPDEPNRFERQMNRLRGKLAGIVRVLAGHGERAGLEAGDDVILDSGAPALSASAAIVSGLTESCGAEGSQPMRSALTLRVDEAAAIRRGSARGDSSSATSSFS